MNLRTGVRDREHSEESFNRADDRGGLRHSAWRQPSVCPARNSCSGHLGQTRLHCLDRPTIWSLILIHDFMTIHGCHGQNRTEGVLEKQWRLVISRGQGDLLEGYGGRLWGPKVKGDVWRILWYGSKGSLDFWHGGASIIEGSIRGPQGP